MPTRRLTAAADGGIDVGPAGEWLLDNYHVVQEHIGEVRESLPRRLLPGAARAGRRRRWPAIPGSTSWPSR